MADSKAEYVPLTTSGDNEAPEDDNIRPNHPHTSHHRHSRTITIPPLLFWAAIAAFAVTMLNVGLLPFTLSAIQANKQYNQPEPTYQPEVNIGLERAQKYLTQTGAAPLPYAYSNGTEMQIKLVQPIVVARINRSDEDVAYYHPENKTKEVMISRSDSTLMQYMNLDPTKNTCTITSFRPPHSQSFHGNLFRLDGDVSSVEVWNLTLSFPSTQLDASELTWAHRPPRGNLLGTINMNKGPNTTTPTFDCPPEGQTLAIELRCQKWECVVHLNQRQKNPIIGFVLAQYDAE